jgi:hypothetical protein
MNQQVELEKEIWSEKNLMELLGCQKKQTMRRLVLESGMPRIRLGLGFYVFPARDVLKWLLDRKVVEVGCGGTADDGERTQESAQ